MKKKAIICLALAILLLSVAGCSRKNENITFMAKVEKIYDKSITVDVLTEGMSFSEASVDISGVELDFELEEGQTLAITALPTIREVFPVIVTAVKIELMRLNSVVTGTPIPAQNSSEIDGVSMSIESGSVTAGGLTLVIIDKNDPSHSFEEWYELKRQSGSDWEDVPVVIEGDYGFNSLGLSPDDNGRLTLKVDWRWLYGELTPGTYKIVKALNVNGGFKYFSAEFKIS